MPGTQGGREGLLLSLFNYFTANPSYEVSTPKLIVTAALANTLWTALKGARVAAKDGNTLAGQKKITRDATEDVLRNRMTGMIAELGQKLSDTDPLWLAFGLNEPGAVGLPDSADGLVLIAGPAGTVLAHWTPGSRSTRTRVFSANHGRGRRAGECEDGERPGDDAVRPAERQDGAGICDRRQRRRPGPGQRHGVHRGAVKGEGRKISCAEASYDEP